VEVGLVGFSPFKALQDYTSCIPYPAQGERAAAPKTELPAHRCAGAPFALDLTCISSLVRHFHGDLFRGESIGDNSIP
jgi:hypothetical protein